MGCYAADVSNRLDTAKARLAAVETENATLRARVAELEKYAALRNVLETTKETLHGIVRANWRDWQELASADEFVRWAKSRANHALTIIDAELAKERK
jgi:hypothetical protein